MIVLAGAVLVLPDRVIDAGSIVVSDGRIQSIHDRAIDEARRRHAISISRVT